MESPTNQLFVVVSRAQREALEKKYTFYLEKAVDETHDCIRFCTAWSTRPEEIDALAAALERTLDSAGRNISGNG